MPASSKNGRVGAGFKLYRVWDLLPFLLALCLAAACGFFTYHGMTAEQVLWAWFKSEILCPKRLVFKSDSYYYEAMQPAIRAGIKRKRGLPMKKNTHDSEETA